MPTLSTIESFIQAVEERPHDQVIQDFYTEDASIQENQKAPRVGKQLLLEYEKAALQRADKVESKCIRPFFVEENQVVIRWQFKFYWKNQTISEIEEVAHQVWEGEKIKVEQFFYDPEQMQPK
ncbi:MAG: nuclear transport factor 2 family protein [Saprospiraceae bacterium]|nr:nuclear transport factor 2 family protein [Saprospiraceae bacterium]